MDGDPEGVAIQDTMKQRTSRTLPMSDSIGQECGKEKQLQRFDLTDAKLLNLSPDGELTVGLTQARSTNPQA